MDDDELDHRHNDDDHDGAFNRRQQQQPRVLSVRGHEGGEVRRVHLRDCLRIQGFLLPKRQRSVVSLRLQTLSLQRQFPDLRFPAQGWRDLSPLRQLLLLHCGSFSLLLFLSLFQFFSFSIVGFKVLCFVRWKLQFYIYFALEVCNIRRNWNLNTLPVSNLDLKFQTLLKKFLVFLLDVFEFWHVLNSIQLIIFFGFLNNNQDSYGYMVAFAGRKYAARSIPAFVANATYTVTSFTLVSKYARILIELGSGIGIFFSSHCDSWFYMVWSEWDLCYAGAWVQQGEAAEPVLEKGRVLQMFREHRPCLPQQSGLCIQDLQLQNPWRLCGLQPWDPIGIFRHRQAPFSA